MTGVDTAFQGGEAKAGPELLAAGLLRAKPASHHRNQSWHPAEFSDEVKVRPHCFRPPP